MKASSVMCKTTWLKQSLQTAWNLFMWEGQIPEALLSQEWLLVFMKAAEEVNGH